MPPEHTGIADYSSELIPYLCRYYDITLIVDQEIVNDLWTQSSVPIENTAWFEKMLAFLIALFIKSEIRLSISICLCCYNIFLVLWCYMIFLEQLAALDGVYWLETSCNGASSL